MRVCECARVRRLPTAMAMFSDRTQYCQSLATPRVGEHIVVQHYMHTSLSGRQLLFASAIHDQSLTAPRVGGH